MSQERRIKEADTVRECVCVCVDGCVKGAVHALSSVCLSPKGRPANESENASLLFFVPSHSLTAL